VPIQKILGPADADRRSSWPVLLFRISNSYYTSSARTYAVAIVDRLLPGLDGLSLVKSMRASRVRAAVLFLINLGGIDDRVEGLEAGGDDYLVKPFAVAELLARVNALGVLAASR
jgi:two-component system OmpR family response regulator